MPSGFTRLLPSIFQPYRLLISSSKSARLYGLNAREMSRLARAALGDDATSSTKLRKVFRTSGACSLSGLSQSSILAMASSGRSTV